MGNWVPNNNWFKIIFFMKLCTLYVLAVVGYNFYFLELQTQPIDGWCMTPRSQPDLLLFLAGPFLPWCELLPCFAEYQSRAQKGLGG